jgi:uncharacterized caspase-like protein
MTPHHRRPPTRRAVLALGLCAMAGANNAAQPGLGPAAGSADSNRVALVIGNSGYPARPLRNALGDARAVAASLEGLGYQLTALENATLAGMLGAMKAFWLKSRDADVRVIYFAGHGVVHEGRNFLLPVDAAIEKASDVARMAARLDDIIEKLSEAERGVNVLILDACRTSLSTSSGSRFIASGLEPVAAPKGTVVAYSTSPGAVAYDGAGASSGSGAGSPYSRHLIAQLGVPGQPIEQMFKRVRAAVSNETANRQVPWENSSLTGDFCFRRSPSGLCPA